MKNMALLAFLLAIIVPVCFGNVPHESDMPCGEMLQKALDESRKNSGAIGVSAAVLFPDGKMWKGASGMSHPGVPLTTGMLFNIASIQKNFQAALALKLAEEGLLALDDPLEKWLPPYPNIDGKITIRRLLNMTSGIDDFVHAPQSPWQRGYPNIEFEKKWTWEEILRDLVGKPHFKPGDACEYSTTNYILLKHIIEKATQSKLPAVLENRLLRPLHLDHTLADISQPIPKNMPIAHGWFDVRGDGSLADISGNSLNWITSLSPLLVYSTPADAVQWIDALFHRKTVLNGETLKAMLTFFGPVRNEPLMKGYGLGVVDIDIGALMPKWDEVRCYGHLGSGIGYTSFVGYFPANGFSVSMMFNRGCDEGTDRAVAAVSGAVLDVLFKHLGVRESMPRGSVSE